MSQERRTARRGFRENDQLRHPPEAVEEAAKAVQERLARAGRSPGGGDPGPVHGHPLLRVALILGSGLGDFVEGLDDPVTIPFAEIPGFPRSRVAGHAGSLVFGRRANIPVVVQSGRFHVYEGISAAEVAFPVRVLHSLGVRAIAVTNAAGAVAPHLLPGDLLLLDDHIHLQFRSPLRGRGPLLDANRFVDLARPYSPRLLDAAQAAALTLGIPRVQRGVYWSTLGPSYETKAEVRMIRHLGGDAVGMSTVNEVLVARHLEMEVLGIACLVNLATRAGAPPLTHQEVLRAAGESGKRLSRLLDALLPSLNEAAEIN